MLNFCSRIINGDMLSKMDTDVVLIMPLLQIIEKKLGSTSVFYLVKGHNSSHRTYRDI